MSSSASVSIASVAAEPENVDIALSYFIATPEQRSERKAVVPQLQRVSAVWADEPEAVMDHSVPTAEPPAKEGVIELTVSDEAVEEEIAIAAEPEEISKLDDLTDDSAVETSDELIEKESVGIASTKDDSTALRERKVKAEAMARSLLEARLNYAKEALSSLKPETATNLEDASMEGSEHEEAARRKVKAEALARSLLEARLKYAKQARPFSTPEKATALEDAPDERVKEAVGLEEVARQEAKLAVEQMRLTQEARRQVMENSAVSVDEETRENEDSTGESQATRQE